MTREIIMTARPLVLFRNYRGVPLYRTPANRFSFLAPDGKAREYVNQFAAERTIRELWHGEYGTYRMNSQMPDKRMALLKTAREVDENFKRAWREDWPGFRGAYSTLFPHAEAARESILSMEVERILKEAGPGAVSGEVECSLRRIITSRTMSNRDVVVANLYERQEERCLTCRIHLPLIYMELDYNIAVANQSDNDEDNLNLLCAPCNKIKGTLSVQEAMEFGRFDKMREIARNFEREMRG